MKGIYSVQWSIAWMCQYEWRWKQCVETNTYSDVIQAVIAMKMRTLVQWQPADTEGIHCLGNIILKWCQTCIVNKHFPDICFW